jgi:3-oxoadipate enol-lactonase
LFHFRGHGRSDAPSGPCSFADLARDLRAVADQISEFLDTP